MPRTKKAPKPQRRKAAAPKKPPAPPTPAGSAGYDAHRERAAGRQKSQSAAGREIGPPPAIADVGRRERGSKSLRLFCETYNPKPFYFGWSRHHLEGIARLEEAIHQAALYAFAWPRGDGKSLLSRMAIVFAILYGFRRYGLIVGANLPKAKENLSAIKSILRLPLIAADFPEVAHAIAALQNIAQRAGGQTCAGRATGIEWGQERIILPAVPPPPNWPKDWKLRDDGLVPTSLAVIGSCGLTGGGIRGSSFTLVETGEVLRPDLVLLDDPQTRKSARSKTQCAVREQLITADLLGMAGPGQEISCVMPCTVIEPQDLADTFLDQDKHPEWRGERNSLLVSMPKNMQAWEDYFEVYRSCIRQRPPDLKRANQAYKKNRAVLDDGAEAAWKERKKPTEVSAIQHAMHLYHRSPSAFFSEYQNTPKLADLVTDARQLNVDDLAAKLNRCPRGAVPRDCTRLTAFVDVQAEVLFWAVCGWNERFGGALIDHGVYPPQRREVFSAGDPSVKLADIFADQKRGVRIYSGLNQLAPQILSHAFRQQETGAALTVERLLVDCRFETDSVHDFIRRSPYKALMNASMGAGLSADQKPMNDYKLEPGDKAGWNWRIDASAPRGRFVNFDTYPWKSFVCEAILAAAGSPGAFYLPGIAVPELLRTHLLSEYRTPTFGKGRMVEKWKPRPNCRENHWWDCIVGCAVAAGLQGVKWSAPGSLGEPAPNEPPRPRVSYAEARAILKEAK